MKKIIVLSAGLLVGISAWAQDVPKVEVPVGFSLINVHPNLPPITSFNVFGGGGQFNVNFGNYLGVKGDFMGYAQGSGLRNQLNTLGYAGAANGNLFTYMFGPQIKKHTGRVQPFGEALFGMAHTNAYATIANAEGRVTTGSGNNNGFSMALGGGIDYKLNRHISLRPVEVDYLLTRFSANHIANYTASQNNFRYVGGLNLTFGGAPPIPPTSTCSVSPSEVMAGEPVTATVSAQNFNPKRTLSYSWSGTGAKVSGTGATGNVDTTGLAPGSYTVSATVTDPKEKRNNSTSCTASFTVKQPPRPPTATCSVNPQTVKPGDSFVLSVAAESPDGSPLTYSYVASAGNISGTGSSATETTSDANAGTAITVTANVVDARGLSTSCSAVVNVLPPVVIAKEVKEVGECHFNMSDKPGRVDNECKAVLDSVALQIQREPNNTFVIVGYTDEQETTTMTQLAGQRAVNVKHYLTVGEGGAQVDPSRVKVRAGSVKSRSAKIFMVPDGVAFTEESVEVDETKVKGQSRSAPVSRKHMKASSSNQ
jgi:OmpA family